MIAVAHVHLWSLCRWSSESPLLVHLTHGLLPFQQVKSFYLTPSWLAPFRLCSRSQPQFSPWDLISKARASAPSPHPSWPMSRQASRAGKCWSAWNLYAGNSPLCPLHPCCCVLLRWSEASPSANPHLLQWKGFLVCENFSSFTAPSQWCRSHPYSFVCVLPFFFCPTQVRGEFLAFWEVWGLLPAFNRCSVGVVPHVDVFLMYLWEEGDLHVLLFCHLEGLPCFAGFINHVFEKYFVTWEKDEKDGYKTAYVGFPWWCSG